MTVSIRIAAPNLADTSVLSASSAVASMPVDRLKDQDIQDLWRATATSASIIATVAEGAIGVVALINSNAIPADLVQVRVSSVDSTGVAGDLYDSGLITSGVDPAFRRLIHFVEPMVVAPAYVRIDLTQSEPPEAGRLVIAPTWEPSRNYDYGWEETWRDWSTRSYSLGQNLFIDRRPRQRGLRFGLRGLIKSEIDTEIEPINRIAGTSAEVLICTDADGPNLGRVTVWGFMEQPISYVQSAHNQFSADFMIWDQI